MTKNFKTDHEEITSQNLARQNLVTPEEISNTETELTFVQELNDKISFLENELDEQKNIAVHALADLDNYRKRMVKERSDIRNMITANIVELFIGVMDNFELGLEAAKQHDPSGLFTGFQIVYDQFNKIFLDLGVIVINPINELFDTNKHDCVRIEYSKLVADGRIINVLRKGYLLNDKMIRPATVVVSKGTQAAEKNQINANV